MVTGEGSLDEQTLHGKAPAGVAAAARGRRDPGGRGCAVATCCPSSSLRDAGVRRAYALTDIEPDVQRCIDDPGPLLERLGRHIAQDAAVAAAT